MSSTPFPETDPQVESWLARRRELGQDDFTETGRSDLLHLAAGDVERAVSWPPS